MAKDKKIIVKKVCLECQPKISKKLGLEFQTPLCGKDFECEWCENTVFKFQKYAQFYKVK
jgi:hypothetical protein